MVVFQCPFCGAPIEFQAGTHEMRCEYCDSVIDIDEYEKTLKEKGQFLATEYNCTQCGALILATDATAATFCSFCGSPVALTGRMTGVHAPKSIIPFGLDRDACAARYKAVVEKSYFAPDWMLDPEAIQRFRGIYMPYYRHTLTGRSYYRGRVNTYFTSNGYDYVNVYEIETPVTVRFGNIVCDASAAFPDTMSYNLGRPSEKKEKPFKLSYLSGYYADIGDIREDRMAALANTLALRRLREETIASVNVQGHTAYVDLRSAYTDIHSRGMELSADTVMNPVWFMCNRRGSKISYAAVDAVDGDVAADIPIDFKKYTVTALVVCGFLSAVLNLVGIVPSPYSVSILSALLAILGSILADREYSRLWRRQNGYDNIGAMSDDLYLKLQRSLSKPLSRFRKKSVGNGTVSGAVSCLKKVGIGCLILFLLPFILGAAPILLPVYIGYLLINYAVDSKKKEVRRMKPPLGRRLLRFLPFLAVVLFCFLAPGFFPNDDTLQYLAAFASALVSILMYFGLVRDQNEFAMRDIPIFTEKRGGDR